MTYASIVVAVDPDETSRNRIRLAAGLADEFRAELIGLSAERPYYAVFANGPGGDGPTVLPILHEVCLDRLRQAHALFDDATAGHSHVSWRSDVDDPLSFLLAHAADMDLLVMARAQQGDLSAVRYALDPADAVMNLGRPVLIVPPAVDHLSGSRVAIGWKNTREARRAVSDAMPFLKRAARVIVCPVADRGHASSGHDLVRALQRRGIEAVTVAVGDAAAGLGTAEALIETACEHAADLLVTGAYGHSRMREWAFGGVTRDLLAGAPLCCLMSH